MALSSLDAVPASRWPDCCGQSMPVQCRALGYFFCWHYGVLRAGVPGVGELQGGPSVYMVLVGASLWRAVPGGIGSSTYSPQVKRAMSAEAEPGVRANWAPGSCMERKERSRG